MRFVIKALRGERAFEKSSGPPHCCGQTEGKARPIGQHPPLWESLEEGKIQPQTHANQKRSLEREKGTLEMSLLVRWLIGTLGPLR